MTTPTVTTDIVDLLVDALNDLTGDVNNVVTILNNPLFIAFVAGAVGAVDGGLTLANNTLETVCP